jgi:arsenate reductase-like glutaredoxin family protein
MADFDWYYHRRNCTTCTRSQDYLTANKLSTKDLVDARKTRIGRKEALDMAKQADNIYATKGTKVVHLDLKKDKPDDDTIAAVLIGPSGNLRAPTIRKGRTLIVGFEPSMYKKTLL